MARWIVGAGTAVSLTLSGTAVVSAEKPQHGDGLTVTYDEDAFLGANKTKVTQAFEQPVAFPPKRRTVAFNGVKFRSKGADAPYWSVSSAPGSGTQCPGTCSLFRSFTDGSDGSFDMAVTFRRRGAVRSFGFMLDVFGGPNQFVIRVVESDGTVTPIRLPADTGDIYVGLHSRVGIKKLVIQQLPDEADGVVTNFAIDRFSRSYITNRCHRPTR